MTLAVEDELWTQGIVRGLLDLSGQGKIWFCLV